MDNTKKLTEKARVLSLCTGYGGLDKGLEVALGGIQPVAYVEVEAFQCENLVAKMEKGLIAPAPIWTNLKTFPGEKFHGCVDVITGGYPCQPFSAAGKRMGKEDPRHLFPHILKLIRATRPALCFFENVEGHLSLGFKEVQASLHRLGYGVETGIFSASEIGAPHRRKRLFILAYSQHVRQRGGVLQWTSGNNKDELPKSEQKRNGIRSEVERCDRSLREKELADTSKLRRCKLCKDARAISKNKGGKKSGVYESPGASTLSGNELQSQELADTNSKRLGGDNHKTEEGREEQIRFFAEFNSLPFPARPGKEQHGWEPPRVTRQTEPSLGGNFDGASVGLDLPGLSGLCNSELEEVCKWMEKSTDRTDEIRSCGNGVVPQTASKAFTCLFNKARVLQ